MQNQTGSTQRNNKAGINWGLDLILTGAFVILMEPDVSGLTIHEWGGLALAAIVLIHVLLHWKWVLTVTRRFLGQLTGGGLTAQVRAKYLLDVGIGLAFGTLTLTGIVISTTLGTAEALGVGATLLGIIRDLHFLAADLGLILAGLHLALNWKWIVNTTRRFVLGAPAPTPRRNTSAPTTIR